MDLVQERKQIYKNNGISYYRPWVFMITDGAPTDEWVAAAQRVKQEEANKGVAFFAVGVEDADMDVLVDISVRQPVKLKGLAFSEMFVWLSRSMESVSHSIIGTQTPLLPPSGWGEV